MSAPTLARSTPRPPVVIVAVVAMVVLASVWLLGTNEDRAGLWVEHPVRATYGGDFAWERLPLVSGSERPAGFPVPTATQDGQVCVAFTRPDLNRGDTGLRATCVAPESVAALPPEGVMLVRGELAGDEIWQLLYFGQPLREIEVDAASSLWMRGRFAAVLRPADTPISMLRWRTERGLWYRLEGDAPSYEGPR